MTASVRAFVALLPTGEAVAHLDDFLEVRRAAADLRWTPPGLWHVTLAFAASVPAGRLDELDDLLAAAALRRPAFGMRVRGGGAFPHPDAARVLHAGLAPDDDGGGGEVSTAPTSSAGCRRRPARRSPASAPGSTAGASGPT